MALHRPISATTAESYDSLAAQGPNSPQLQMRAARPQKIVLNGLMLLIAASGTGNGQLPRLRPEELREFSNVTSVTGLPLARSAMPKIHSHEPDKHGGLPEAVVKLHSSSGLTWEQLAGLFGVSRRAIHNWASGGNMTSRNVRILRELIQLVEELPAKDAATRRAALLLPGPSGRSMYELLRDRLTPNAPSISGTPFEADQLIGVLHE